MCRHIFYLAIICLLPIQVKAQFPVFNKPVLLFDQVSACQPDPCEPDRDVSIVWGEDVTNDFNITEKGDINGDGLTDFVGGFTGYRDANGTDHGYPIRIFLQEAGGTLVDRTFDLFATPVPEPQFGTRMLLDDFNDDGMLDIFVCSHGLELDPDPSDWVEQDTLVLSNEDQLYEDKSSTLPGGAFYSHGCTSGDIDNDGDVDLVVSAEGRVSGVGGLRIYLNDGNGSFSHQPDLSPQDNDSENNAFSAWVELLDTNRDGYLDLYKGRSFGDLDPNEHYIVTNDGKGSFRDPARRFLIPDSPRFQSRDFDYPIRSYVTDFTNDGLEDLIIINSGATGIRVQDSVMQLLVSDGSGRLIDETMLRLPAQTLNQGTADWYGVHVVDIDGDGDIDIVRDDDLHRPNRQQMYLNDGTGTFKLLEGYMRWYLGEQPLINTRVSLDLGNDGDIDFVGPGCSEQGCGTAVYEAVKAYPSTGVPWARIASTNDINGSGDDKIVVGIVGEDRSISAVVYDLASVKAVRTIKFLNNKFQPLEMLTTSATGGIPDGIAILGISPFGRSFAVLKNAVNGSLIARLGFLNINWTPKSLTYFHYGHATPQPAMALLAQNREEQIVAQVRNVNTGKVIRNIFILNKTWFPIQVTAIVDYDEAGNDAIAVLARNSSGRIVVHIRDVKTAQLVRNIFFFNANWIPLAMEVLPVGSEGAGADIAVMGWSFNPIQTRFQVKNTATAKIVRQVTPFLHGADPITFISAGEQLIPLAEGRDARILAKTLDPSGTSTTVHFLNKKWTPIGIAHLESAGESQKDYLATLAVTIEGDVIVQVREAVSGQYYSNIQVK